LTELFNQNEVFIQIETVLNNSSCGPPDIKIFRVAISIKDYDYKHNS